ncbi:MAG: putative F0F1-ATPase [Syntrophus sp. PtaU1.Bin005]|jgi:ATP synthase protein I|uniref:AtpZ/AtpI family protein n=1 Tax=Syntrophus TaxID=43773 RepID=UPI0009C46424|nr:MAG: putative F0F1-ATPase [Syntrophus sp. PtaB.Bin138]OPY81057.1 MAG: putative F0F1-ATPase [Syntrophus sp. PtaU1.Bin005]
MDKESRETLMRMAYASSVGIGMVLAIFGCLYLGRYLDEQFGTGLRFTIIFLLLGIAAGFRNLYYIIKKYSADEKSSADTDDTKK